MSSQIFTLFFIAVKDRLDNILQMWFTIAMMKLNVKKIKVELKRLGWSYERLAKESGLKSKQSAYYYLKSKSIYGADKFGKALGINPRDLIR